MLNVLVSIYVLPLISCLILCLPYRFSEKTVTRLTGFSLLIPALTSLFVIMYEGLLGLLPLEHKVVTLNLYGHVFDLMIWVDMNSIVMMTLTHLLGLMVIKYSHGYLHLEKGYQRFFSTILFFIFGMYIISLAGTVDLFFAGWEIVGFSSFFLIAFYRAHTRSVVNAWRVYNIYRVCDVGLLMGAVLGHILWHEATRFSLISNLGPESFANIPSYQLVILSLFLVFASVGKSAQFPFQNWPSKAMEGPTPSSAIFYGALSIHAGVFLLLRTHSIWSVHWEIKAIVAAIGIITFFVSTLQGRTQSNIKGQIAFASTAQIGIMYVELSFGFLTLAVVHLFFHALLRCFQLLVSPSIVANSLTLNNKVILARISKSKKWEFTYLPKRINATLYTIALNDFFMDPSLRGFSFLPWRKANRYLKLAIAKPLWTIPVLIFLSPLLVSIGSLNSLSSPATFAMMCSSLSLFFSLRALFYENNAFNSMLDLTLSLCLDMLSIYLIDHHSTLGIGIFMASVVPALLIGLYVCKNYSHLDLQDFHAKGSSHPVHANLFLLVFMVLAGMPVSSAFFGEDIILEELINDSVSMAVCTTVSLMLNGLICVRIYTRVFMGSRSNLNKET